ncbi:Pentatricopeptide repeat-containing protein 2, mitochondrial [Armadillidium vulgare]|nr:Pentatricopeptide repeat-containing protein 2, mitochondrial [Armadillidium vulgare]
MNCTRLILRGNVHNLQNRLGKFLKLFPDKSYYFKAEEEYGDTNSFLNKLERLKSGNNAVFVEDLKVLIACCEDDKSLVGDTINLTKRYFDQIKDLHIKPFVFGSIIMRLLYIHDLVDEAFELILDEEYGKFFNQKSSYQIIMDKLFKKGKYEEIQYLMNKLISEEPFEIPGTEDALENSLKLLHMATSSNKRLQIRVVAFAAGLALKLKKPAVALEIVEHSDSSTHFFISNIRVLAKARLGHIDDVLSLLKSKAINDLPKTSDTFRKVFSYDVIEEIEQIVNETIEMEKIAQFKHLKEVFETTNLLSNQTFSEVLCTPIHFHPNSLNDEMKNRVRRKRYEE